MSVTLRSERPSDAAVIEELVAGAFRGAAHTSHTEQFIVNALRLSGKLAISLVAEQRGGVVGHVAVSPVSISDGTAGWYGLGPISVAPRWQGQGIGGALTRRALTDLRQRGAAGCVVLGDPRYYARFGFRPGAQLVLPGVPAEYFQALALRGRMPSGEVAYDEAFDAQD